MKCPYCGHEMEPGELRGEGHVYFLPLGEIEPIMFTESEMTKRRAISVEIDKRSIWAEQPNAHTCRQCLKIIVDF